jgi:alpha-glucosidase
MAVSMRALAAALAAAVATEAASPAFRETPRGISVDFHSSASSSSPATLVVEVGSMTTFRLGVRFDGWGADAIPSISLDSTRSFAPFQRVQWGNMAGVQTSFGALVAATDGSGAWAWYDASNTTLFSSLAAPSMNNASGTTADAGVILPVNGTDVLGPGPACLGNGLFGPLFYYNRAAGTFALPVSASWFDPDSPHCYPASFSGSIGGQRAHEAMVEAQEFRRAAKADSAGQDFCDPSIRRNDTDADGSTRSAKYPNGLQGTTIDTCCAACNSAPDCVAFVWSDGSNPDPTGNCWPLAGFTGVHGNPGRVFGGPTPPPPQQAWWAMGPAADWYLAPAPLPLNFTASLYELTGAAAIPPRHAVGFMATYWGYDTINQVAGNGTAFRDGMYPIDSLICDYDWWLSDNNGDSDFTYRPDWFNQNNSFITPPGSSVPNGTSSNPAEVFSYFWDAMHLYFAGIRKPRTYSNIALSNASGWLLPDSWNVGAGGNNWNMSAPGWKPWYEANHTQFLADGMKYWWLDEGETQYYTYSMWSAALAEVDNTVRGNDTRHFTVCRSFQPGMQRVSASSWTGDRQDCSHATVLTFTTAGQPYTACDMTSPDATVLVRQYQNAVFMPIMRVHAMHGTPRFPFLWGGAEHQAAFRAALNTRYAFIPHIYSGMHAARISGSPIVMPASYIFTDNDPSFPLTTGDATYMMFDHILPADVSTSNGMDPNENTTHVNIPPGTWFAFNTTSALSGPIVDLTYTDVPLDQLVVFIRAGSILTLNKAVVQYTGQLGGDLVVQVYAGRDGSFTLVEDDGDTTGYQTDFAGSTRRTAFTWNDATRTLSWTVQGGYTSGPNLYTAAWPVLFVANASAPVYHSPAQLGVDGSVSF